MKPYEGAELARCPRYLGGFIGLVSPTAKLVLGSNTNIE